MSYEHKDKNRSIFLYNFSSGKRGKHLTVVTVYDS